MVLAGPNGSGKSSVFDAFKTWQGVLLGKVDADRLYFPKADEPQVDWQRMVNIEFHEPIPDGRESRLKLFSIRSAYRNESDFSLQQLPPLQSALDSPGPKKMIDNDVSVGFNYRTLVAASVDGLYSGDFDESTVPELRNSFIGQVQDSMSRVFDDLVLSGLGNPLQNGSFFFDKGMSSKFHYKNLSGGEKAVFDLILDLVVKSQIFDDTIYCIDEPEAHISTRLQSRVLAELVRLIPERCQLWIATHFDRDDETGKGPPRDEFRKRRFP